MQQAHYRSGHLGIYLNGPSTKGNNQNERVGFLHGLGSTLDYVVWPSENAKVNLMTGLLTLAHFKQRKKLRISTRNFEGPDLDTRYMGP